MFPSYVIYLMMNQYVFGGSFESNAMESATDCGNSKTVIDEIENELTGFCKEVVLLLLDDGEFEPFSEKICTALKYSGDKEVMLTFILSWNTYYVYEEIETIVNSRILREQANNETESSMSKWSEVENALKKFDTEELKTLLSRFEDASNLEPWLGRFYTLVTEKLMKMMPEDIKAESSHLISVAGKSFADELIDLTTTYITKALERIIDSKELKEQSENPMVTKKVQSAYSEDLNK